MRIGDRVETPIGIGTIVGEEFPHAHYARWVVELDVPFKGAKNVAFFKEYKEVCPFEKKAPIFGASH